MKNAYLIGKDLSTFKIFPFLPEGIALKYINITNEMHISYYILSIARLTVIKTPNSSEFEALSLLSCNIENIEETIADVESYIYKFSLKPAKEIESYLARYEELMEQDSLNYSVTEEFSALSSLMAKSNRMSEWIAERMKGSAVSNNSSIIHFEARENSIKNNPFELASSIEDKSSVNCPMVSVDEIIDSNFVNSLIEMGNKKKTIIMQVEDKPESCQCKLCPLY